MAVALCMQKNRMEALSDGVFAIALTLLAFDLRVPRSGNVRPVLRRQLGGGAWWRSDTGLY